ncbi:MAG: right-handed parallel beta-helix repeat-containing protein [Candidatus Aegiribacteria sp.]|nr:right-handed parallel beta-helix repeat-containing protein [Candidatus Aegiribacteria sp.]
MKIMRFVVIAAVVMISFGILQADEGPEYDCHGGVITIDGCSDITIDNCTVSGCGAMGFRIIGSESIRIQHCLIEDNSFSAFYLRSFHDLDIDHCIIRNNGRLIYSTGQVDQTDLKMRNNEIYNDNLYYDDGEIPGLRI